MDLLAQALGLEQLKPTDGVKLVSVGTKNPAEIELNAWQPIYGNSNGIHFEQAGGGLVRVYGTFHRDGWTYVRRVYTLPRHGIKPGDVITVYSDVYGLCKFLDVNGGTLLNAVSRGDYRTATVPDGAVSMELVQYAAITSSGVEGTEIDTLFKYGVFRGVVTEWTPYTY